LVRRRKHLFFRLDAFTMPRVTLPRRFSFAVLVLLTTAAACTSSESPGPSPAPDVDAGAAACTSPEVAGAPLGIKCNALVDREGRTVLLHGVNARVNGVFDVTFADGRKELEPIPAFTAADASRIRAIGFNALRLPIQWSAIEPTETGGFDEAYLAKVDATVKLAGDAGLYVLVDIHQDAFSKEIGEDGAPLWAIVPPATKLLEGPLDDLGDRRSSKQVTDAFATFFGASTDGVRLRERFAAMAVHVAARYAQNDAVIGLEIFNEPIASDPELLAFDKQISAAVRAAAPQKLVLFEPSATRNIVDKASLGAGPIAPGTVYAPHVYTLSFTGSDASRAAATKETFRASNERAREEADSFGAPLVITEFGWDPKAANFASFMRWQSELQDEQRASSFLWLWKESSQGSWGFFDTAADGSASERASAVAAVMRVRLESVPGALASVAYDADAKHFETHYTVDASVTATTARVFVGVTLGPGPFDARCDGNQVTYTGADVLEIPCGGPGAHVLTVDAKPVR
jgi:endoglycosylceramidase